jgi:chromosome segregation ATPase
MEAWLIPLLGSLGAAALGVLSTLLVQWMNRDKTKAEARSTDADYGVKVTESAVKLINELQDEQTSLRERLKVLNAERAEDKNSIDKLREQLATVKTELCILQKQNASLTLRIQQLEDENKDLHKRLGNGV